MRSCPGCGTVIVADSYVVDTGVFLRWFVDQDGFEHARELQQELVNGSITVATIDSAGRMIGMYDALFVHLAEELELPILSSDTRLSRAAGRTVRVEVLRGVGSG